MHNTHCLDAIAQTIEDHNVNNSVIISNDITSFESNDSNIMVIQHVKSSVNPSQGTYSSLGDFVKISQNEKQCKIDLSKTNKKIRINHQIQRNVSSTALTRGFDKYEHLSTNNIILDTTLTTTELDKSNIISHYSCTNDYSASDEECSFSCSSTHEYITVDEASNGSTDDSFVISEDSVFRKGNSLTPTFQRQLNKYRKKQHECYARSKFVIHNQTPFRRRFPNPPPILAYSRTRDSTSLQQQTNDTHAHLPWFRYPMQSKASEWINHLALVQATCRRLPNLSKANLLQRRKSPSA